jgi:hypothetical protein
MNHKEAGLGTNTALTVVSMVVVIGVLAVAAWAFLVAPFVVPWRHAKH